MPVGASFLNDSLTSQIDQDYINFGLLQKGSITLVLDTASRPNAMRIGSITVSGSNPIVAISCTDQVSVSRTTNSGNTWTFYFRAQSFSNLTLNYWVFDNAGLAVGSNENVGMMVFRADGSVAYHSGTKPLTIVDVFDISPPPQGYDTFENSYYETRTYTAGRTYAVVQGTYCYRETAWKDEVHPEPVPIGQVYFHYIASESASAVSGANVGAGLTMFENYYYTASNGPDTGFTYGDLMFWVIDVTNY